MGPYAFFVLGSYAITGVVVGGLILRAILDHRAQLRALDALERRGQRRRSAPVERRDHGAPLGEPLAPGQS